MKDDFYFFGKGQGLEESVLMQFEWPSPRILATNDLITVDMGQASLDSIQIHALSQINSQPFLIAGKGGGTEMTFAICLNEP